MPVVVEVRLVRLARRLEQQRRFFRERHANRVRSRGYRDPDFQVTVERRMRRGIGRRLSRPERGRRNGEQLQPLIVEQQLDLVRLEQPFDVFIPIARKPNRDVVFAVDGERVRHHGAAARADGKPVEMRLLRQVRPQADCRAARRETRPADRELADFFRCGDITLEQRRRQVADGDVVESVAGRIARQQRRGVDVERKQIANRVAVFGAVEPAERIGAAGIWRGNGHGRRARFPARPARPYASLRRAAGRPGEASAAHAACGRPSPTRPHDRADPAVLIASSSRPPDFTLLL